MKKEIKKLFFSQSLFIAGTLICACTNEDDSVQIIDEPSQMTYTLKVDATIGSSDVLTRALSLEGKDLIATWSGTESVYAYDRTSSYHPTGTLTPQGSGKTTSLLGTLTGGIVEKLDNIELTSPRFPIDYTGQIGTLEDIAAKYDYARGYATVTDISGTELTTDPVSFDNLQAIVKFTLTNEGGTPVNVTNLTISDGGSGIELDGSHTKGDLTITPVSGTNVIYAAIAGVTNSDLTLSATDGTNSYTYMKSNVTFENGKYYEVAVKMKKQESYTLSSETGAINITSGQHAILTGTGGSDTHVTIADGAIVTLNNVTINTIPNDATHKWAGLTCLGNAIILLEGTNSIKGGYEDYPGIHVATGKMLTISGSGSLTASSGAGTEGYAAAIGAGYAGACGSIIIKGGDITAIGGKSASGIGGVQNNRNCGDITISDGTINAYGGYNSTGIGAGGLDGKCGNITITGGFITAKGKNNSPGIGAGEHGSCGTITISGGTINASSGSGSSNVAAIGTGINGECGSILISGGSVTASGYGVVIGCGYGATCGDITVTNGVAKLRMEKSSSGSKYLGGSDTNSTSGSITIDGVSSPTTSSTFPNFTSSESGYTWTLTHK